MNSFKFFSDFWVFITKQGDQLAFVRMRPLLEPSVEYPQLALEHGRRTGGGQTQSFQFRQEAFRGEICNEEQTGSHFL